MSVPATLASTEAKPDVFKLENSNGLKASFTNFGGRLISLWVPDRMNQLRDVVLGYDRPDEYLDDHHYFGALIGRYANRVALGRFSINDEVFQLNINNGPNTLHGGPVGLHNRFWSTFPIEWNGCPAFQLSYLSRDGEEGYPGNLDIKVIYCLTDENEWVIEYKATTDKDTIINLTHHSYFNLAGEGYDSIGEHRLQIFANAFLPIDADLIPTGEIQLVDGSAFDFRESALIGSKINGNHEQLQKAIGFDHNWVLNKSNPFDRAARVFEPHSGRVMEVWTSAPGLQLYTGNFLNGSATGKEGKRYLHRSAFCLETQHFPDSPNRPNFPSVLLKPGATYYQKTVYKFSVE